MYCRCKFSDRQVSLCKLETLDPWIKRKISCYGNICNLFNLKTYIIKKELVIDFCSICSKVKINHLPQVVTTWKQIEIDTKIYINKLNFQSALYNLNFIDFFNGIHHFKSLRLHIVSSLWNGKLPFKLASFFLPFSNSVLHIFHFFYVIFLVTYDNVCALQRRHINCSLCIVKSLPTALYRLVFCYPFVLYADL